MGTIVSSFRCGHCGEIFEDEEPERINYESYCKDCAREEFTTCDLCGKVTSNDDIIWSDSIDKHFCEDCIGNKVFRCDWCSEWEYLDNSYTVENDTICSSCASDTSECYECGGRHHYDDLQYSEREGEYYCNNCYRDNDYVDLHEAGYKPEPVFHGENGGFFMGIENEVDVDCGECENFTSNFFYCKEDGSIEGFEIVSHPFTLEYEKNHNDIKKMCERLQGLGITPRNGYGLHVHVSRDCFINNQTEKRIALFFYENAEFIAEISGRTRVKLQQWAKINTYTREMYAENRGLSRDRYSAINVTNEYTIEFRFFRNVVHYNMLMGCLEFIQGLVGFCNITDPIDITLINFKNFLLHNKYEQALYLIEKREGREVSE